MTLGIDLSSDVISFSYLQDKVIKTCYIDDSLGYRTDSLFNDKNELYLILKKVKNYAESITNSNFNNTVIAIPWYCNYMQTKNLRNAVKKCDMLLLRTNSANEFASVAIAQSIHFDSSNYAANLFLCTINSDYAEFSLISSDDVIEHFGSITIKYSLNENIDIIKKRVNT